MNTYVLIPLIATIAYIPLFVILFFNYPWDKKQKFFFLFLIPAMLWSLTDIFFRSDFFMEDKLLLVKVVLCSGIWMGIQAHYFLLLFYRAQRVKIPFAYILVVIAIALAGLDYMPESIEITARGISVAYGNGFFAIVFLLFALFGKDFHHLLIRRKTLANVAERNQIAYLFLASIIAFSFVLTTFTKLGAEYPASHLGNFATACILTYAVVAHRLLDIRIVFRRGLKQLGSYGAGIALFVLFLFLAHLAFNFEIDRATLALALAIGIPVIAFTIHIVDKAWQRKIEQAFTGEKYNHRKLLSGFAARIHSIPTLEQFGSELISLLSQSIDCRNACLLLPENGDRDFAARFTYPPVEDNPMQNLKLRHDSPVVTWLKRENTVLPESNLSILPEFHSIWQEEKEDIQSAKIEMFVPLTNRGELVAVLAVSDKRNGKLYTVEDIDLLESVASRVAASMEKEYLHERLQEQDNEITFINRLNMIITSSLDIQEIFEQFTKELKEFVAVDYAMIALIEGERLRFSALSSQVKSVRQVGELIPFEGTATKWVCEHRISLYEADLQRHPRFPSGRHYIKEGIRSIIHLPLIVRDEAIGSLIIASCQPNAYSQKQIRLLEQVALQIATPIENSQLYAKAKQVSRIDELTGLFNRRHFEERLKEEIARHSRHGDIFSLFLLDLDNFKTYNDIYGHPSGDKLLSQIAEIIRSSVRGADQAFRYGGDEFVAILPETATNDAYRVAERVREQIATEMEAKQITVTCSIGLASYPSDGVIPGAIVTTADTALYYAKRTGGNRVYLSSKILSEPASGAGIDARSSGLSAVYALAAAVDAKDPYTYNHSRKVNTYAVALAEAIGLSPDEVSRISTAALLHDIGKVGISDKILHKKGKLSPEDWEAIKSHPRLGANIVGNVPNLVPCLNGVLYHHERWDGTGYPEGLKGEQIPLEARILALADAYAAMTSSRPYRDALCDEKVIKQLKQGADKQFDPKLVEAFIGIVETMVPEKVEVGEDPPDEQSNL